MKNSNRQLISAICLWSALFCAPAANSQRNPLDPLESVDPEAAKLCLEQNISRPRTYGFQQPRWEKAYGPRPWYYSLKKIVPFWNDNQSAKYSSESVNALKEFGLQVPLYETERSKKIRLEMDEQLMRQQIEGEDKWNRWLKKNPNAPAEQKEQMEFQLRFQGLAAAKLPRFDWREAGLDPGKAGHQGRDCNSCWAFASLDAFQMSRQLIARRANKSFVTQAPSPYVRQLLSCMIKDGAYCMEQKPDAAFTYLVDNGLPLGGSGFYDGTANFPPDQTGWTCDKTDAVKALTWDYVSGSPQTVPEPAEIKRAVVTYGAVVAMVNFDDCLALYGSGVFNEEQFDNGSHLLLIIGWDDLKEAWLVKNSYGRNWGERGFGWIKYGSNNIGQLAAYVVADPKAEERFLR